MWVKKTVKCIVTYQIKNYGNHFSRNYYQITGLLGGSKMRISSAV